MIWFLRLFAAFRALESQVADLGVRNIALQDKASQQEGVISELRTQLAASREELIESLKDRPAPVANAQPQMLPPHAIHGRDFVRLKTNEYYEQRAKFEQAANDAANQVADLQ